MLLSHYRERTWWRHQMEIFSALLAICAGNSPVPGEFPHKGQWRGALMFSLICVWINGWVNNRKAGDLRRYRIHYDVIVMSIRWNCIRVWCLHQKAHVHLPFLLIMVKAKLKLRCLMAHCRFEARVSRSQKRIGCVLSINEFALNLPPATQECAPLFQQR